MKAVILLYRNSRIHGVKSGSEEVSLRSDRCAGCDQPQERIEPGIVLRGEWFPC
jgi:hypothetical protein